MRYKLTVEYEAADNREALLTADRAMDELPYLNHSIEVQQEDTDPPVWDEIES